MSIDFVVPWVDGDDPLWQRKKRQYGSIEGMTEKSFSRYRDWGIFHYWFRSVEANAPWVRRIYLITDRQIPCFLVSEHPKLRIVYHDQFIPEKYLPTFSSHPIELNLHLLLDLSEYFVYFNDDMFLNQPMKPEDFFRNGKPCYSFIERPLVPCWTTNCIQSIVINDMGVVNRHFTRKNILKHPNLFLNYRYGKYALKNAFMLPWPHYQHFEDNHMPCPFLKSTLEEVWEKAGDILDMTCQHRFRSNTDVNQYLFRYWDLARGNFAPYYSVNGYYLIDDSNVNACADDIRHAIHPMICVNDRETEENIDSFRKTIQNAFHERYPLPCSFER